RSSPARSGRPAGPTSRCAPPLTTSPSTGCQKKDSTAPTSSPRWATWVTHRTSARVHALVLAGMGLVVLHSGHFSKIFKKLMGTTCNLKWREEKNEREVLWVTRPGHPIVAGIDDYFVL